MPDSKIHMRDHVSGSNLPLRRTASSLRSKTSIIPNVSYIRHPYTYTTLILSLATTFLLPAVLLIVGWWLYFDILLRCLLAEYNRFSNQRRLQARVRNGQSSSDIRRAIASIVGYRESTDGYQKALESLARSGVPIVIAGVDGNDEADVTMLNVCHKVWKSSEIKIVHLPISVGKEFFRETSESNSESDALDLAANFLTERLLAAGVNLNCDEATLPRVIGFTQPHGDLKEIRLTSWALALVLSRRYGFEFLWSTDSDTMVLPDTISTMSSVLAAEPRTAGASAFVGLHNADASNISTMTSLVFATDTYLNRAATGALGRSEYLHGPATMLRMSALQDVIVPWCRFHYFFDNKSSNCVLNEDVQYSMLLSQTGWQRLYVENAAVLTGGPETLRGFLGQRLRWSRGIMLHRVLDAPYILKEGPLTSWYMLRTAFYDVFVFAWILYYAVTGQVLCRLSRQDLVILEVLPPVYNYLRSRATVGEGLRSIYLYPLYRMTLPYIRAYTLVTPLRTTWALPSVSTQREQNQLLRLLEKEHESIAFVVWAIVVAIASARLLAQSFTLDDSATTSIVCAFMLMGASAATYAMTSE